MRIYCWDLFLLPLEELHCGFGVQQGNILPSLDYIPGRVVRGGLAGWALRQGHCKDDQDEKFKTLFLNDSNSCVTLKISFPWCTYRGYRSTPLSLFHLKGGGQDDPRFTLVSDPPLVLHASDQELTSATLQRPLDFLRREKRPSQIDPALKPVKGLIDERGMVMPEAVKIIDLRASHGDKGRVEKGGLYAEESLPAVSLLDPANCYYSGCLCMGEDETVDILKNLYSPHFAAPHRMDPAKLQDLLFNPLPQHLLFLGRRRLPVVAFTANEQVVDTAQLPDELRDLTAQEQFTLTFLTDYLSPFPLTAEKVAADLGLEGISQVRVFCNQGLAHGYNVTGNKKIPPRPTIVAGSCGLFKSNLTEAQAHTVYEKSLMGLGENTKDGFGRFVVNWPIHHVNSGV